MRTGDEVKRALLLDDLTARIMNDDRFPPPGTWGDLRVFALTCVWATLTQPKGQRIAKVGEVLRLDERRFYALIGEDAPRYEPEHIAGTGECEAPMIRRSGPCGKNSNQAFRVTDPATGRWRIASFCRQHRDYAYEVHEAERARQRAGTLPTAAPNRGGLLPCYLRWGDWEERYRRARPDWEPPEWGVRADDWPVWERVDKPVELPQLRVIDGEGGDLMLPGAVPPPKLRVLPRP